MALLDSTGKREKVICIEKEKKKKEKEEESIDVGDLSLEQRDILILRCVN